MHAVTKNPGATYELGMLEAVIKSCHTVIYVAAQASNTANCLNRKK